MQPEFDELRRGVRCISAHALDEPVHCLVHLFTVREHLGHGRARREPALCATVPFTGLHVVGIEEKGVPLIDGAIPWLVLGEHERLEESARVGKMPLSVSA